ncbi:kinase-like protein [Dendrothele bispora CBS 962.96]|uniref:Kinase-like protein n=1 Tax=Dendrothele bispora (strain CBS 962.96) TaxID=1314807 RepID=A0A4S8MT22_DENBC|nr:kinase-like protein [Dendrothele bispora CBS 962.96]
MKIVKRDNPKAKRERQYRQLRQQNLPRTDHVTVVDGIKTAEQEIRREIAIMKKCYHPHVVRLYEVIDDRKNDQIYLVMEYLGGGEIKYTNERREPILTVEQTRRIMRDAILGLEYLHHQGIIHRDIKPANLIWTANHDRVKIADFGTAHFSYAQRLAAVVAGEHVKPQEDEDPTLLNDAALAKRAGSPAFLAPEIVWEYTENPEPGPRPPVTKAIDIWALGVTLYCFLFGKTPFRPPGEYSLSEWTGYNYTCNHDWRAGTVMGYDRIPTGGRHPSMDEDEDGTIQEGPVVMHLLDHFLKKDYWLRITLDEVKVCGFVLFCCSSLSLFHCLYPLLLLSWH